MAVQESRPLPRKSVLSVAIASLLLGPGVQAATVTVTTGGDSAGAGDCTLRQAIVSINGGGNVGGCAATGTYGTDDTIVFHSAVTGTITLGGTELGITQSMSIQGPGAAGLAVDGDGTSRVFNISGGPGVTVSIDGLTIQNGSTSENGGGIALTTGASLALSNSTVSGHSAGSFGGGLGAASSSVTLTNSSTTFFGGGIYAPSSSVTLTNSTVSGNSSGSRGGGLYARLNSSATLTNSTVSGNSAGSLGGGLGAFSNSSVTLSNTLLAGNDTDCFSDAATVAGSFNLIGDAAAACDLTHGTDNNLVGVDPSIGPLADNGCLTPAGDPNGSAAFYGCLQTHALLRGSPAINAGTSTDAPATDQRGVPRPQGSGVDIGAYEARFPDVNGDSKVDILDLQYVIDWFLGEPK